MSDLWPTEHCDYLRELATDSNRSRAEMADMLNEKFGTSYTRNSVIGKCGRLGLCSPMPKKRAKQPAKPRRTKSAPAFQASRKNAERLPSSDAAVAGADTRPRPEYGRFKLLDLRDGDCRWPAGYGPYHFCGRPICAGSSYCAEHYAASTRLPYRWEARA